MSGRKKILLADDDVSIRRAYAAMLDGAGYEVAVARNGEEAVAKFAEFSPDLVLMDVMMPKMNGMAACMEIRRRDPAVPVLFVTAAPSEESAVRGLGLGGDDYIDKTRPTGELLARIAAALRRSDTFRSMAESLAPAVSIGDVSVDFDALKMAGADGRETELTRSEAVVLRILASKRGRFVAADEILDALHTDGGGDNTLRVTMSRLKTKLGRAGNLIVNQRFSGYKLLA
jgi:DNA-binding response OmpR family regulator